MSFIVCEKHRNHFISGGCPFCMFAEQDRLRAALAESERRVQSCRREVDEALNRNNAVHAELAESERQLRELRGELAEYRAGHITMNNVDNAVIDQQRARIAYLEGGTERLQDNLRAALDETGKVLAENRSLRSRALAAEKDAERYRWLRKYEVDSYMVCGRLEMLDSQIDVILNVHRASGIDAARDSKKVTQ